MSNDTFSFRLWLPITALSALWVCHSGIARAEAPTPEMQQAICRIHNGNSAGSGTLVGRDERTGLVVTCHHIFSDGVSSPYVIFPNGERLPANVVATDRQNDLAALSIMLPSVAPVPLADYRPSKGEVIYSAGCGGLDANRILVNQGSVTHYTDHSGAGDYQGIKITGGVRAGDSGGPMFNDHGELAAVLWGGSEDGVYGTGSQAINVMLAQCPGGTCPPTRRQSNSRPQQQPQFQPINPPKPAIPAPQQPAAPPAKGCECKGHEPCKCDGKAIELLTARIKALESLAATAQEEYAAGKLKGAKGDPGPAGAVGPQGPQGEPGQPGKDAEPIDPKTIADSVHKKLTLSMKTSQQGQLGRYALIAAAGAIATAGGIFLVHKKK